MTQVVRAGASTLAVITLLAGTATAQEVFSTRVATGFTNPVFASAAPGSPSTLYVVQQGGQVRTLNTTNGQIGATPFLDLTSITGTNLLSGGEQGLMGLAFHPNYQANGLFYVNYTTTNGTDPGGAIRVEEYQAVNGTVDPGSRRTIIQFNHPTEDEPLRRLDRVQPAEWDYRAEQRATCSSRPEMAEVQTTRQITARIRMSYSASF